MKEHQLTSAAASEEGAGRAVRIDTGLDTGLDTLSLIHI